MLHHPITNLIHIHALNPKLLFPPFPHHILQLEIKCPAILIVSDSELLVKQMTGQYRIRNFEIAKIKSIADLMMKDKTVEFKHILREKNKIADKLANQGINKKELADIFKEEMQ